jgi:internalin A
MKYLAPLANLETLILTQNFLTDDCLDDLKKLKKLKELRIEETQISEEGIRQLKEALPKCRVLAD